MNESNSKNYYTADVCLTLMVYSYELEVHTHSDYAHYDYFFKISDELRDSLTAAEIEERLRQTILEIYDAHGIAFRAAEPDDPNYIAVVECEFRPLNEAEIASQIWQTAELPPWETSNRVSVSADGYVKSF